MHTVAKKVYMSILTCIVILLTMVATTYAWVGILTSGQVSGFDIELKTVATNQSYSLKIAGNETEFGDSVARSVMQKQILENMGYNLSAVTDEDSINSLFVNFAQLKAVTTTVNPVTNEVNQFYEMNDAAFSDYGKKKAEELLKESNRYYKFDLYLTVEPVEGMNESTEINANVFLSNIENTLIGTRASGTLINNNPFTGLADSNPYSLLKTIPNTFSVNSIDAARIAFSIYQPIEVNAEYTNELPLKTIIYQGGTQMPSYNSANDTYSLGGILPEQYNMALKEINTSYSRELDITNVPTSRLNDLELISENRNVWSRPETIDNVHYNFLGISNGVKTKIKLTVYFWFEGWDADCLEFIEKQGVEINLAFCTDVD